MRYPKEQDKFLLAASLLNQIKNDSNDLPSLLQLQKYLLRQICRIELKTRLLKKGRKRLKRSKSSVSRKNELSRQEKKHQVGLIKSLISSSDERLNDYKQLLFLWRCFGDAIVGIYHSTYSLKHLFYNGDYNPKPMQVLYQVRKVLGKSSRA